jgi:hypothetical protein
LEKPKARKEATLTKRGRIIVEDGRIAKIGEGELKVETVLVGGEVAVQAGRSCLVDEYNVFERARALAADLWERT